MALPEGRGAEGLPVGASVAAIDSGGALGDVGATSAESTVGLVG